MKYLFITSSFLFLFQMIVAQSSPDLFISDWKARTIQNPDGLNTPQTTSSPNVTITINATDTVTKVSKYLFGGNLNPYSSLFKHDSISVRHLRNLSPNVLRWPGGNLSNDYFWNAKTAADLPDDLPGTKYWLGSDPTTKDATTPDYYKTLEETNATGCICVNYSYARYGLSDKSVQRAAHLAAEWVRYDKGRTRFWEIGNENFGNWQSGYEIDPTKYSDGRPRKISGLIYGQHCNIFIDSMRAAAAEVGTEIYIGVQAWEDYTSWDPIQTAWNDGVFPTVGNKADFLVIHNYFTPYQQDSDIPTIFGTLKSIPHFIEVMNHMVKKHSLNPLPVALTEYNLQSRQSGQLMSYINGMHAVSVIAESVKHGIGMANRWSTVGWWSSPGEMGTFSYKEPDVPHGNMRPEFYYYYFMQKYFGDVMVNSASTTNDVASYATSFSSGQMGVMLVNTKNETKTIGINLQNFKPGQKYWYYELVGGKDNGNFSANVFVNGHGSEYIKGGPSENYFKLNPFATNIENEVKVDLPPYGTVFMLIEGEKRPQFESAYIKNDPNIIALKLTMPVDSFISPKGFTVFKNGSQKLNINSVKRDTADAGGLLLAVDSTIFSSDEITISYYDGNIQTSDSLKLVFFENKNVVNLLTGSPPVPLKAQNEDVNTIEISFSKNIKMLSASGFQLTLPNNISLPVVSVSTSPTDSSVVLIQTNQIESFYEILLSYNGNQISGTDGGILAPFKLSVQNWIEPEIPELDSAILDQSGYVLTLHYNQPMDGASKLMEEVIVLSDNEEMNINTISTSENKIIVRFAKPVGVGTRVLLNYNGEGLVSALGLPAASISNLEIENNVILIITPEFIQNVSIKASGQSYEIDIANEDKRIFTDRDYGFKGLPALVKNAEYIRWPMGLKSTPNNPLLTFSVRKKGKVYVAHDNRLAKPTWLTGAFTKTNYSFMSSDAVMTLYEKSVEPGMTINFGSNQVVGTETGACANYVVLFVADTTVTSSVILKEEKSQFTVFPNPARGSVSISAANRNIQTVRILSINGSLLAEKRFLPDSFVSLDLLLLNNGMYLLEIYDGTEKAIHKLFIRNE
jgi:hypothetical protein